MNLLSTNHTYNATRVHDPSNALGSSIIRKRSKIPRRESSDPVEVQNTDGGDMDFMVSPNTSFKYNFKPFLRAIVPWSANISIKPKIGWVFK
jgi:hypothetical protein